MSVVAQHFADKEEFKAKRVAGSFHVEAPDSDGERMFWYCCPCGCGDIGPLLVGAGFKPTGGPSWNWNGSTEAPQLDPSVNHVGHWHGYLRAGAWAVA